jgi:hypothetical protein
MVSGPFGGLVRGVSNSICLYYDDAEKAIYTQDDSSKYADENGKLLVVDMDDPYYMGADRTARFGGFTSGKIKMSITTNNVFGDYARYMILTIDNQTFEGEKLNDITPPALDVDLQGYQENALPKAQVGKLYPFFSAFSVDKMYGELPVNVSVKKDGVELYHLGNGFIPSETGVYKIEYSSADGNYNESKKTLNIQATQSIEPIVGELIVKDGDYNFTDESLKDENGYYPMELYFSARLPKMLVSGGSGKAKADLRVSVNGKDVPVENNVFIPTIGGIYSIRYVLTDYIGTTKIVEYTVAVAYSDVPRLNNPIIPEYMSVGQEYQLPKVESEYYTIWNQRMETYDTITVYKADGETVLYVFDGSEPVSYKPSIADGERVVIEYASAKEEGAEKDAFRTSVKILSADKLSDRFVYSEGVSMTEMPLALNFSFTDDTQSVRFINPLSVFLGAKIVFNVPATETQNSYNEVWFTFTDSLDKSVKQTVRFYKNEDPNARVSYISIDGVNKAEFPASFYGNVIDKFDFTIYQDGSIKNINNDIVAKPVDFGGFTSGCVYVEFGVGGCTGVANTAVITLSQLRNQVLGDQTEDFIKPTLFVEKDPVGMAKLGSYVKIPAAFANDVFNMKVCVKLEVTFNGKTVYTEENQFGKVEGTKLLAYDYGTYSLTYTATDCSGNSSSRKFSIRIRDNVAPTIIIDGKVPEKVKLGKKLELPKAYALDNVDVNLPVYAIIIDPMNVYTVIEVGETYEVKSKGRYIVKFYCEDSCYNTSYSEGYYFICE